jgi:DNA (cytosine-5)-methyltransferase 1
MRYFESFAGVGGFSLAMPKDWQCIGMSEIDKYASSVLRYRFPNITNYGEITKIDWTTVPDFDLLVGGSPCQSFSVAGRRKGFEGASGLFFEYIRAIKEKRPAYFIWENVKGVLSCHGGRDFAAIINQMAEAGYSLWWQVLNAKDFGVPQNLERVFVVGSRTRPAREVFFERGANEAHPETCLDASCTEESHVVATRHLNRNGGLKAHYASSVQVAETPHVVTKDERALSKVVEELVKAHFL